MAKKLVIEVKKDGYEIKVPKTIGHDIIVAESKDSLLKKLGGKCSGCGRALPFPSHFRDAMKVEVKGNPATAHLPPGVSSFKHDYHKRGTSS